MSIINYSLNRRPTCQVRKWLTEEQIREVNEFLLRVLNSYLNTTNDWFAARDLVGGFNRNWSGSAWDYVYRVHKSHNENTAYSNAAKDMGYFLMNLLKNDSRQFETKYRYCTTNGKKTRIRIYRWINAQ